jgi:hypothetical protein
MPSLAAKHQLVANSLQLSSPFGDVTHQHRLRSLRNVAVIVLFLLNATWMAVMMELAGYRTASLHILHTNPLGLLFLFVYGTR